MGGGSNSAPPSDVAPGGGTFPTNAFGTAYNPDWTSSQMWGGAAKGLQGLGKGFSDAQSPIPSLDSPQMPQAGIDVESLMDVLRRMGIGSQGYGTGGFDLSSIIPK